MENIISDGMSGTHIFCVGLSHKTTDLGLREKIHVRSSALPDLMDRLRQSTGLGEAVVLSTCNRFEVYAPAGRDAIGRWISGIAPDVSREVFSRLSTWENQDAVKHLFSVAAGLDAQVLGETQIIGQVKEAYEIAKRSNMTGQTLNTLFQAALSAGKRIRTETKLSQTPVSVSSVAVRLCEKIFERLAGKVVLVVGAGEISCLAADQLSERGARISIFSTRAASAVDPVSGAAETLARSLSAPCLPLDALISHLASADIVISGSGAPHILLTADQIREAQNRRRGRPLFLVDLAIPRDIDASSSKLENVFLYNLDDLDGIAQEHRKEREKELPRCEEILEEETFRYWSRMNGAVQEETLRRFHSRISGVVEEELKRSGISGEPLESLKKTIPNRVLSEAFKRSRESVTDSDRQTLLKALKEFFGL